MKQIVRECWASWLADTLTWVYSLAHRLRLHLKRKHKSWRLLDVITTWMYGIACTAVSHRERVLRSAAERTTYTDILTPLYTNTTEKRDGPN